MISTKWFSASVLVLGLCFCLISASWAVGNVYDRIGSIKKAATEAEALQFFDELKQIPNYDVNFGKNGTTMLMVAAEKGYINLAKLLVKEGANINAADAYGSTALSLAAGNNQSAMVKYLISIKANVNQASAYGYTALMEATRNGNTDIVKLLLAAGANPSAKSSFGQTALDIATTHKHEDIAILLRPLVSH